MNAPDDRMPEQSRPWADSLTLTRETARGFVDRGNRFQMDPQGAFLADRWRTPFFNVRRAGEGEEARTKTGSGSRPASPDARAACEPDAKAFTMRFETVRGFIDRGGTFVGDSGGGRQGDRIGDRWISGWFNVRHAEASTDA